MAKRLWFESAAVFAITLAFLFALAPAAPFTKELGVCESGAVRDVLAGNIILPRFLPGPMVHVPPLYWWTAALCVRAFGWTELALRLPSMVAAAATCAVIFAWLGASVSRRAGVWAAAALLLCHFFTDAARQPRMDSMLALFITAAAVCLERAVSRGRTGGGANAGTHSMLAGGTGVAAHDSPLLPHPRRMLYLAIAALMMALGILAKSVIGLLPGLVIAVYMIVRRRFWELFRVDLIVSFVAAIAVGVAWFIAAFWVGGDKFLAWQLGMNLWHRFLPTDAGGAGYCAHPFYYFVPQTLKGFIPWSLYLPAAAVWLWPRKGRRLSAPIVYTLCWFAAIFVFFSSSEGKCLVYILPAFVPLAALAGCTIDHAIGSPPEGRAMIGWFNAGSAVIAVGALLLALAALALIVGGLPASLPVHLHPTDREFLGIFGAMAARRAPTLMLWIAAFIVGPALTLYAVGRMRARLQVWGVLVVAAAGALFWFGVMNPALAEHETLRGFAREVAQLVPPGATVGHIGLGDCDLDFYSPRPLPEVFHFSCKNDPAAPRYIVLRQGRFDKMAASQRACLKPIAVSAQVDSNGSRILVERVAPSP
ncbi:MAG: ArnT family glycosyltransferase [Candidatus Binataceae bacterium]